MCATARVTRKIRINTHTQYQEGSPASRESSFCLFLALLSVILTLLKLFNENDKNTALLSKSLKALPITAKRLALKRLLSKEFEAFKRVKITDKNVRNKQKLLSRDAGEPSWYLVLVLTLIVLVTLAVAYIY